PYARAIEGSIDWDAPVFGFRRGRRALDHLIDGRDDAWGMPRAVVIDPAFDWGEDARPETPWTDTLIYEAHVKGLTALHPDVPANERGTYRGLSHPAVIDYLTRLGVTAIELLPVHAFIDDEFLVRRDMRNYWGYKTLGFFAPEARYSSSGERGEQVVEFKRMVKSMHDAGIEVILDVVYNHTAEGGILGPTLSFRGIDNSVYYRLFAPEPNFYEDVTGTGNTLQVQHPQVLKLIMDSLRYWVEEMHVDGFRFDLAPALSRENGIFNPESGFVRAIHQDPVLSTVKLIAEPWDLGPGGYRLGEFPHGWSEWNDRFRDVVRRFWRGDRGTARELAMRLAGSPDLFAANQRRPSSSINFVTAHDGFTLNDLVSYERKRNLANGEMNRDGSDNNYSWNNGVEGMTDDTDVLDRRRRASRNLLATLLFAQGVPMLLAGDEAERTQLGNNNAYCQDNPLSWISWDRTDEQAELEAFVRETIAIRRRFAAFRQLEYSSGIERFDPAGTVIAIDHAQDDRLQVALRLRPVDHDSTGGDADGSTLFVVFNGEDESGVFCLPDGGAGVEGYWDPVLANDGPETPGAVDRPGNRVNVNARSVFLWRFRPDRDVSSNA
ncbi:MAG: glycogen debranching protein GlgX, partial [Thermomicrobiales bacterium]|nr:glycogen debranching protein GlgX [Thermomicrobiales bacterium]